MVYRLIYNPAISGLAKVIENKADNQFFFLYGEGQPKNYS